VLTVAVVDLLILMELVMLVLFMIVTYVPLIILENVIDVFKENSYTTTNVIIYAPLELIQMLTEVVSNVDQDVLYVKTKPLAQNVLSENYYKEKYAKINVTMDISLLMESVHLVKTTDAKNAIPN
jgi:hypothetical protein